MESSKGIVVVGGTESDTHVVSLYLASIMLEESGYDVVNHSCQNHVSQLMGEPIGEGPVLAYVVCNQNGHALEDLRDLRLYKPAGIPVLLGGHYTLGCHNKIEQQAQLRAVGVDHFVETLEELIPLLEHVAEERSSESWAADRRSGTSREHAWAVSRMAPGVAMQEYL